MVNQGPDPTNNLKIQSDDEDVEGHVALDEQDNITANPDEDVEGHIALDEQDSIATADSEDDVEGHIAL